MVAEKGTQTKTQQQREQHFELLNSTQIVISEALENWVIQTKYMNY